MDFFGVPDDVLKELEEHVRVSCASAAEIREALSYQKGQDTCEEERATRSEEKEEKRAASKEEDVSGHCRGTQQAEDAGA